MRRFIAFPAIAVACIVVMASCHDVGVRADDEITPIHDDQSAPFQDPWGEFCQSCRNSGNNNVECRQCCNGSIQGATCPAGASCLPSNGAGRLAPGAWGKCVVQVSTLATTSWGAFCEGCMSSGNNNAECRLCCNGSVRGAQCQEGSQCVSPSGAQVVPGSWGKCMSQLNRKQASSWQNTMWGSRGLSNASSCQAPAVTVSTPNTAPYLSVSGITLSWTPQNNAQEGDIMNIFVDYLYDEKGMPRPFEGGAQLPISQGTVTYSVPNGTYIVVIMGRQCADQTFAPVSFEGNLRSGAPGSVVQPITCSKTITPTDTSVTVVDAQKGTVQFSWFKTNRPTGIPKDAMVWANLHFTEGGTTQAYTYAVWLSSGVMELTGLPKGVEIFFSFRIYNGWMCQQSVGYYTATVEVPPPN